MSTNRPDLFSSLFRWAHRRGEDFTTDGFVFVVNELLVREPDVGRGLLRWLCFGDKPADSFPPAMPIVGTQRRSDEGIPDIYIQSTDFFALIEVKKGGDLHAGQLRQYHTLLARHPAPSKRLVLVTAHDATFDDDESPDEWWKWGDVEAWLEQQTLTDDVAVFLVDQFLEFLRRQVMTVERVEWQYVEGVRALYNLTTMLGKALEHASVPIYRGSAAWDSRGHYTKDKQFWTGIYMNRPEVLRFQFDSAKPDVDKLKEVGWEFLDNCHATTIDLASEATCFFSLSKENQLKILTEFVANAYNVGQQCIVARRSGA